jgi:hypothetical protein
LAGVLSLSEPWQRSRRSKSISVRYGRRPELLLRCFAGCKFEDIIDHLQRRGLADGDPQASERRCSPPPIPCKEPDPVALEIWRASKPIRGTIAQNYLERRGIPWLPPSLRYYRGAMIAGVEQPHRGITAIQKTALTPDGEYRDGDRWTKGDLGNGAVRLGAAQEIMGIAEGTETALSAITLTGMTVWGSLGAARLQKVELPPFVREVHIFADNDQPGREAAYRTSDVHRELGRTVKIRRPPPQFKDFNDFITSDADAWAGDLT